MNSTRSTVHDDSSFIVRMKISSLILTFISSLPCTRIRTPNGRMRFQWSTTFVKREQCIYLLPQWRGKHRWNFHADGTPAGRLINYSRRNNASGGNAWFRDSCQSLLKKHRVEMTKRTNSPKFFCDSARARFKSVDKSLRHIAFPPFICTKQSMEI